jgi:hypothetical protein
MGFLDKAKKLAEQAQTKLDDVQGQMNQQGAKSSGAVTEYDKHGRPVPPAASMGSTPPAATPGVPPVEEDRNHPSYAPPPLTSGDPLAG